MIHNPNLPPFQQSVQHLADQFNRDERFWRSLAGRRKLRRKLMPWLTPKEHKAMDVLEFSRLKPLDDCVGFIG